MTWFKSFSDGRGGFNTFEWSFGESLAYGAVNLLLMLTLALLFLIIMPAILLVILVFNPPRGMRIASIISIMLSTWFLIDYSVGGILWNGFSHDQFMIDIITTIATFHAASIIINIMLMIMADNLFKELNYTLSRQLLVIISIVIIAITILYPALHGKVSDMRSETKYGTELPKN